jgi:hypothetical protein
MSRLTSRKPHGRIRALVIERTMKQQATTLEVRRLCLRTRGEGPSFDRLGNREERAGMPSER